MSAAVRAVFVKGKVCVMSVGEGFSWRLPIADGWGKFASYGSVVRVVCVRVFVFL